MLRMGVAALAAAAVAMLTAGCSVIQSAMQDAKAADAQIAAFHQKLNAQDFDGVYASLSPETKATIPEDAWVRLLTAIHTKLGPYQSGKDVGWYEKLNAGGHFLTINYSAQYARGAASESFVYRIDGGQARLAGYHVNSNALIEN